MFSEVAEIALVAARLGQFQQLLKTRVILILNFTRPRAITYTNLICHVFPRLAPTACSYRPRIMIGSFDCLRMFQMAEELVLANHRQQQW